MAAQGVALERVGEVDAVAVGQFAVLQAVVEVAGVGVKVALGVRLLYAAAGGGVVVCYGEAYHGAVGQADGTLHEALAEGAAADDGAAVLVLHGAGDYFCGGGRELVDEHEDAP